VASATAPPSTAKSSVSTDPLYTDAVAQAKAALAAAQAPVQGQQAASDAYYKSRAQDATDEATALSNLLKGIGPATQQTYDTAAQNQGLLATGFSHGMQDALQGNTDNLNAMLDKLGQNVKLDSHAQEAGDVTYGLGGYIPGSTFTREGAAFGAAADQLPATALLRGQDNAEAQRQTGDSEHAKFDAQLADMASKLPGDVQSNYEKLQSLALQNKRFALAVQNQKFTQALKIANQKLAVAKYNTDVQYKNANLKLSAARINLESQKFARQQVTQDRSYALSLARLGIEQKRLQLSATQQEYKLQNGGLTTGQITKYKSLAQGLAMQAFASQNKATKQPVSYKEALASILQRQVPLSVAQAALDAAGFKPGVRGAPSLHDQQQIIADIHFSQSPYSSVATSVGGLGKTQAMGEISSGAVGRGLDPQAVLAVASMEGLGGGVGDNNSSFGPWQLHVGGAFPRSVWDSLGHDPAKANEWAWSPQGINYALDQIAKVAHGLTGEAAIVNIVRRFERSANQPAEIAGASRAYRGRR
jgi:hypothetical protein